MNNCAYLVAVVHSVQSAAKGNYGWIMPMEQIRRPKACAILHPRKGWFAAARRPCSPDADRPLQASMRQGRVFISRTDLAPWLRRLKFVFATKRWWVVKCELCFIFLRVAVRDRETHGSATVGPMNLPGPGQRQILDARYIRAVSGVRGPHPIPMVHKL